MLAMLLITYHFIGSSLLHIFSGIIILGVGLWSIRWWLTSSTGYVKIYDETKTNILGNYILKSYKKNEASTEESVWSLLAIAALFLVAILIIIN